MYKFSVIVPFKMPNNYLNEMLSVFNNINYKNFELILLPDIDISTDIIKNCNYPVKIKKTGEVSPAIKRNIGAEISEGEILAFIDEDAYPTANYFDCILETFESNTNIGGVGGPQLTPHDDPFLAQVSGAMYLSPLIGSGALKRYTSVDETFDVDDWPTVNLCVKKSDFISCGGFDSSFWPGEDTKFCLDFISKTGKRLVYNGKAIVFHHRRSGFRKHIRQISGYGLHRGFFAKKFPKTSLRLSYIIPSGFFLFVLLGWILTFTAVKIIYFALWSLYVTAILYSFFKVFSIKKDFKISLLAQIYLILTHFFYGYSFIKGLLSKNIYSRLSR